MPNRTVSYAIWLSFSSSANHFEDAHFFQSATVVGLLPLVALPSIDGTSSSCCAQPQRFDSQSRLAIWRPNHYAFVSKPTPLEYLWYIIAATPTCDLPAAWTFCNSTKTTADEFEPGTDMQKGNYDIDAIQITTWVKQWTAMKDVCICSIAPTFYFRVAKFACNSWRLSPITII